MRHAAYSDVATVHLEHNVEVLERKLIELRAEIDAILSQLASEKVAAPAIEGAPTPEAIAEATEPAPAAPAQAEITSDPSLSGDGLVQLADAMPLHTIASDPPSTVVPLSESEAPSQESLASDDLSPVDAIDQTTVVAETAETAAPQAEMQFDPREAAMPIAPVASLEPDSPQPASAEPSAAAAPERAAEGVPASAAIDTAAPAAARVISLELRRRKERMSADTLAPTASRRRLATKIAASIVALLVAATLLVIADKQAVGSAPALSWMSPSWPSLGDQQGAGQDPLTDQGTAKSARAAAEEALLLRYREAWPTSW